MFTDLVTPTEREVHNVGPIRVNDSERFSAHLGVSAPVGGVVTKLQKVSGFTER